MATSPKASIDQHEYPITRESMQVDESIAKSTTENEPNRLQRSLKGRQIGMFSIAGAIGTGLLIATGPALAKGGPGSLLIGMIVMGFVCYNVLVAYGEMSTAFPMDRGFSGYAARFVDPAYGCATGFNYFFKYVVLLANNLTASGLIMQYWLPHVNVGVWIVTFAVPIIFINCCPVKAFGEVEFAASIIKTIVIVGLMVLCLVIDLGGGPRGERLGFRYWRDPGAFNDYLLDGSTGRLLGLWACMVSAGFAYMGAEMVGLAFGEAEKPWKQIPTAIRQTAWRISFLYVGSVFLLGMVVPYNSPGLMTATKSKTGAGASPFIVAIKDAGIAALPGLINGSLLVFVLSAANSDIYIASRTLYGLARDGHLPNVFTRTYANVPLIAVGTSSLFFLLALMSTTEGSSKVFGSLVSLATVFGLFNWISILVTYISFRRGMNAQSISHMTLPFSERWMVPRAYFSLLLTCLVVLFNGVPAFIPSFDLKSFVFSYTAIPVHLALIFGGKVLLRTARIQPKTMNLSTGIITAEQTRQWEAEEKLNDASLGTPSAVRWIHSFRFGRK